MCDVENSRNNCMLLSAEETKFQIKIVYLLIKVTMNIGFVAKIKIVVTLGIMSSIKGQLYTYVIVIGP